MPMQRAGVLWIGVVLMSAGPGLYAASLPAGQEVTQAAAKHGKMVSFTLKNDTGAALSLKCGEEPMTLDPGKTTKVTLPMGATVTFAEASGAHAAGSVLTQANSVTKGTTVTVH